MPKIISRTVVSTSDQAPQLERPPLHTYYCVCGEFALISATDAQLERLPKRQTDLAAIVSRERRVFRLNAKDGAVVLVKRNDKMEKQLRKQCTRCGLWIAYEVPDAPESERMLPFVYVVDGALVAEENTATE
ncbi:hypothetical protein THASP1DRAFT_20525 [Thamnocephalis sphaerospora]|uniref:STEEP1 domain-containing protein n=1 Tax=Thamnocephalis sphaerospora TaxID=78915 RepID=A0A4P9XGZ2_9FUNG|nr:hypothetical protein THASP1DRAFT_20525 [Thamnocephalis sphaerospora]|eukprot:RKP04907.1 hypothetical protein THASP1DRAFT_20525 [Thamnocephalis sphaerospora]